MDAFMKRYAEKIKKRKGRASGGFQSIIKKKLKISQYSLILVFFEKSSKDILWVKIAKGYIHADREFYLE